MKKKFTILIAAAFMLLTMMASTGTMWGQTRTEVTDVMNQSWTGVTGTSYSPVTGLEGSASDAVYSVQCAGGNSSIQLRSNNNNSGIVSTTSGGTVTKVTVTWNSNTLNGRTLNVYGSNSAYSAPSDLYGNNAGTLIGTIVCGTSTELTISDSYSHIGMRSASGAMYLTEIDVTWETGGGSTTPSITANNVEIDYDSDGDEIEYTIDNPVSGGELTASTTSDWLTLGDDFTSPIAFTCTTNTAAASRTATVTLTYTYSAKETVTKNVTVTQAGNPDAYITIAEARAQGSGNVVTKGYVTSCVGTTGYIQDVTAAICVYGSALTIGDEIRVAGTLSDYNGLLEITNPTVTVVSSGNTIDPELMTIAEAVASTNQGWFIRIENATVTAISGQNTTIAQGESTIVVRGITGVTLAVNDIISFNGNIGSYNGNQIANPQNVEVQQPSEPTITLSSYAINAPVEGTSGILTVTYENITDILAEVWFCDAAGENDATYDWVTADINTDDNVEYLVEDNTGAARTAYFKVWAYDDDDNEVYSNLVTISQAEYVVPTYAALPFEFNGGRADIETTEGLSQDGLGTDYNASTNPTTKLKFDGTGDWLLLQFNERPGTLTFDIKGNGFSGGTFTVQTSVDGLTYTDLENYTDLGDTQTVEFTNLAENIRYIKWIYTEKSSGNVGLGNIALAKYVEPSTDPTIDADDIEIAYNATEGAINYTLENPASDGNLTAAVTDGNEGNWLTLGTVGADVPFSCTANNTTTARIATVTLTYKYNNETETKTATAVVTQTAAPQASIEVEPAFISVDAEDHDGTLTITVNNMTIEADDLDIEFYDANEQVIADIPTWILFDDIEASGENFSLNYTIGVNDGEARAAYIKVFGMGVIDFVYSNLVTINQAAPVVDYATLPFEFDGGRADIETTNGLTQEGLDSDYGSSPKLKFNTTGDWVILKINEVPGKLTFDIKNNSFSGGTFTVQTSEDGVTYTDLENYTTITGTQSEEFDNLNENVRYIKWIYTEKASGNVGLGNIKLAKPDNTPSITLSSYSVEAPCTETIGSLTVTYKNIATDLGASIYWYESDGTTSATYTWIDADINSSLNVDYMIAANDGANRTAYFKVYGVDNDGNDVYSDLVTVNQAAYIPPVVLENYALFTGNLVEGDYIIYYNGKAMKNTVTSARLDYTEVTSSNNVIATDNAAIIWHIAPSGEYWTIYSADADAYAAGTGVNNKAQMLGDGTDDMALWTVSGTETFEFVNKYNSEDNKNANLRNNGTYGFACYSTSTGGALTLYKRTSVVASYDKVITGYGNNNGGYYLIASPVSVNPTEVEGMVITDPTASEYSLFDLYSFDQSSETEWYNYKASSFYIKPGKGYLYAKKNDVTLTFNGMPYVGDGTVNLNYDENAEFEGWNLIGNPYATAATIPATQSYYTLNTEGSELIAGESTTIAAMEGIFVKATAANQSVTFTPQNKGSRNEAELNARVILNLKGNNTVIDRAIIRFSEGDILPKFMLDQENTKLYIPQNNDDYAVVRSEAQGEMPVNFKAAENGTYTIDFSMDNVEFSYLHLIDNKTGMDIDLLQTSNYTFEASKIDYASRFKLVFSTNSNSNSNDDNDFAFFDANGNLLILGNEGTATLQVIDITGRTVSSETFSGNYSKAINAKAGVYMLRLIQGNDVRTQKIVVR